VTNSLIIDHRSSFMKKSLLTLAVILVVSSFFVVSPGVAADEYGLDAVANPTDAQIDLKRFTDIPTIVGRVLGAALSLVGILFFAMMVYGGVVWMTAHGNTEQSGKALKTMVSAIIGLVIVLSSYTLVNFVFKAGGGEGDTSTGPATNQAGQETAIQCCVYPNSAGEDQYQIVQDDNECLSKCVAAVGSTNSSVCSSQAITSAISDASQCSTTGGALTCCVYRIGQSDQTSLVNSSNDCQEICQLRSNASGCTPVSVTSATDCN
jgi:hypothetical protein